MLPMPWGLKRIQQARCLHFVTFSCHHRDPLLAEPQARTVVEQTLERVRQWYGFYVCGYAIMPEHLHLLISEPDRATLSRVLQMLKQNTAHLLRPPEGSPFWLPRYYDFNVWSEDKRVEKLRYMHRNPVSAAWSNSRRTGCGAVSATMLRELKASSKSSRNGPRGSGSCRESSRQAYIVKIPTFKVKIPTLSRRTRQGWGTPLNLYCDTFTTDLVLGVSCRDFLQDVVADTFSDYTAVVRFSPPVVGPFPGGPMFTRALLVLSLLSAGFLAGCSSSSSQKQSSSPIFTSAPVTAAAQGEAYSYTPVAVDPAGAAVTYSLTTGPTGAALSGNAISWTPTAAQSRTSDSFTVTATSSGGTATQSWTVSPTGIVTVSWINTYWEPSGAVQVPVANSESLQISAVAPQPDGSLTVLKGATTGPGIISIAGVPAGNYWLAFGGANLLPSSSAAYWTSTSTFDLGHNIAGFPIATLSANTSTQFDFILSGLDSVAEPTSIQFNLEDQIFGPLLSDPPSSTTLSAGIGYESNFDWSKSTAAFLGQYEPITLGALLNVSVLGASASLSDLPLTNGGTNTITQTLQHTSPTSLNVSVQGSQWAPMLAGAAPAAASSNYAGFSLAAEPFVVGINAPGSPINGPNLNLAVDYYEPLGISSLLNFTNCDSTGFQLSVSSEQQPGILTDQNLGALDYNDPFPSNWTRSESFCEEAIIPVPVPNSTATLNFALVTGESVAPSGTPLAPLVGPVQNPTINGGNLFTAATLSTTTPSFSWTAPTTGAPYGYEVLTYVLTNPNGAPNYLGVGVFYTSQTSITLPPLSAGNTYVFAVTALVDGTANIQTSPNRSSLPTAFANVVSAPITISSGAADVVIHGDASVVKRLSQPAAPPKRH
jgi:REP element-mobilizing transposase RayT